MRFVGFLLVLAGCTNFDDVPRGVCGNGLLEPGEDCDSTDPSCVRCAVSCSTADDCPSDDYACGVDGFCHAPGGQLGRPTAPVTFQADDFRVTDVDHDGRGDVIGVSRTSVVVRYGDAAASLTGGDSFVTPAQSGPASFGDLDGDGSLDVTLTTVDGLVTYTSPFGALSAADIETPIFDGATGQPVDILAIHALGPLQFIAFGISDGVVIMLVFDFVDESKFAAAAPCQARLGTIPRASFDISKLDIYRAHADGAVQKNALVSFTTSTGAVCAMSISGSTTAGYTLVDVTPPAIGTLAKKPILADLETDADPCPGLVSSDGGPAAMKWFDGRMTSGRCTLDAAVSNLPALPNAPANAVAIGRIPINPAIPLVAADALVTTNGIYGHVPGIGMVSMYQSSRPLAQVTSGDLDGDGDIDAAATAATEDDIDIFYRYDKGVELLRYDTAAHVTTLTIADFDGNGVGDLAYTEAAIGHQDMFVAYGTHDRQLPPLKVAAFSGVASVTSLQFPDSADNLSVAADLLVVQPPVGSGSTTATLLHGSPQRTMLSFLDPRADAIRDVSLMRGTVVGAFGGDERPDLMMFAAVAEQQAIGMRAFRVAGTPDGLSTAQSTGTVVDGLVDCQLGSGTGACAQDALYLAWPRAGGDVVIAVDHRSPPRALRIDPGQSAQTISALVDKLPVGATIQSLYATDLDGDGTRELVAAFVGSVRICDVSTDGMPTTCTDIASALPSTTASCIDAAPGRVGERGLVALCREGTTSTLYRITKHGGDLAATELAQGVALRSLRVGDVTGDGVDDVVAVQGDASASAVVVFPQCTSRDLGACGTAKEAGQ